MKLTLFMPSNRIISISNPTVLAFSIVNRVARLWSQPTGGKSRVELLGHDAFCRFHTYRQS